MEKKVASGMMDTLDGVSKVLTTGSPIKLGIQLGIAGFVFGYVKSKLSSYADKRLHFSPEGDVFHQDRESLFLLNRLYVFRKYDRGAFDEAVDKLEGLLRLISEFETEQTKPEIGDRSYAAELCLSILSQVLIIHANVSNTDSVPIMKAIVVDFESHLRTLHNRVIELTTTVSTTRAAAEEKEEETAHDKPSP
jgi:hypothetical protein